MPTSDRLEPSTTTGHVSNDDDVKKNQYIAKLRDLVVDKFVQENRTTSSLADDRDRLTRFVEQRIAKMFTDFHTPNHPTYAFMILRAITELDEGRSDNESISEFIRKEYEDLPVAHESVLKFQLNRLCEKGEILLSAVGCYLLPVRDYVQQKITMKENGEEPVEKMCDGGGEFVLKGCDFKGNGAVGEPHEGEGCSRQMNGRKGKGKGGLRNRTRWSRRLQYDKIQVDEANRGGSEFLIADHRMKDQQFGIFEDPFEPPGFSSKIDQLMTQKEQSTVVELSPLIVEDLSGLIQCQGLGPCTDNVPDQPVLKSIPQMALEDQLTLSTEVVTMPANPTPDACPTALLNFQVDDYHHSKKQDTPMRRGRGRPPKTSNGFPIITEKPKKKDRQGRPRKKKPDELSDPTTDVEVEKTSKKRADSWDREVAGSKDRQQNSNSINDWILALECASQNKEGTNKRKRIERPSKFDKNEISETMDFPKAKKGRGKGIKKNCYTDISVTDLIYSQDHLLQPMTRFRGRPRKL